MRDHILVGFAPRSSQRSKMSDSLGNRLLVHCKNGVVGESQTTITARVTNLKVALAFGAEPA